jgi:hypothetical protein
MQRNQRRTSRIFSHTRLLIIVVLVAGLMPLHVESQTVENQDFQATWAREDQPVASGSVGRTWLWGPQPYTAAIDEPYGSNPGDVRTVQYFDKARMEINDPQAERNRWYVTTGLLASELMTGAMQTSDHSFLQRGPALIPVGGDLDDPDGPTYGSFDRVRNHEPFNTGTTLTSTIDRAGDVGHDQRLAAYSVLAGEYVAATGHTVASVFWTYLNTSGPVIEDGELTTGRLFDPWFYATGYPVTEAYWADVAVGGERKDVLIQIFERRVLTYTPSNQPGWRVEMGNVGLHYHAWRYDRDSHVPEPAGSPLWMPDLNRIEQLNHAGDGWSTYVDLDQRAVQIAVEPGNSHHVVSRYWYGGSVIPSDGYRLSAEVQMSGPVEAGIGSGLEMADGTLGSMIYVGLDPAGTLYVTREEFLNGESKFLLRPSTGLPARGAVSGEWIEIAVTVSDDMLWVEIGNRVVGMIEMPAADSSPGVAIVAAHTGTGADPAQATFRNIQVQLVVQH